MASGTSASCTACWRRRLEQIVRLDVRAPDAVIEDACQFAWSRLLHHRDRVHRETVMSWLARTAVHEAFKLLRRDRRELSLDAAIEDGAEPSRARRTPTPQELIECRERLGELGSAAGAPAARRLAARARAELRRDRRRTRAARADRRAPAAAGAAAIRAGRDRAEARRLAREPRLSQPKRAYRARPRLRRRRSAGLSLRGFGARLGAGPPPSASIAAACGWPLAGRAGARRAR